MNVISVSPFTGEGVRTFIPGQAIFNVLSRKRIKSILEKFVLHGYDLGVLACSTLGELNVFLRY